MVIVGFKNHMNNYELKKTNRKGHYEIRQVGTPKDPPGWGPIKITPGSGFQKSRYPGNRTKTTSSISSKQSQ